MATNSSLNIECGEGIIEDADNFPVLFDDDDAAHSSNGNADAPQQPDSGGVACKRSRAPGRGVGVCWEFLSTELDQQLQLQTRF